MSNKVNYSWQLLALSLGIGCCFSGLPAIAQLSEAQSSEAQSSEAQSSEARIEALTEQEDQSWLNNISTECDTAPTPSASDVEFVLSVLSSAGAKARQIEDISEKSSAFSRMGKSYACINQPDSARIWLEQALLLEGDHTAESTPLDFEFNTPGRLLELATIYGVLIGDAEQAQLLLAEAETSMSTSYGIERELTLELAELYGEIGNTQRMNTLMADVVASVEIHTDATDFNYIYPPLETAARLHAKFGQYQQLRQLIDDIAIVSVREDMMAEAALVLHQAESPADRELIAQLFPDFDIVELASQHWRAPTDQIPSNPIYDYRRQLRDPEEGVLANMSAAEIAVFIADQEAIINQIPEILMRAVAYKELGDFLSYFGQPSRALLLFERSLQQFSENISEDALAEVSHWDITEYSHTRRVQGSRVEALVREGNYEQGYRLIQTLEATYDEIPLERLVRFRTKFAYVVDSPTYSLSADRRLALLAESESLVPQLEDKEAQFEALIDIAEEYLVLEEMTLARQLAPTIADTFEAVMVNVPPDGYSRVPEDYSEFLISMGEYDQAIALAEARKEDFQFTRMLPAQFVEAGEYEIAKELRASFDFSVDRLIAGRNMVLRYQSVDLLDEALDLTKQLLDEAISADLAAEEVAGVRGTWNMPIFSVQEERINRMGEVLMPYRQGYTSIRGDMLAPEEVSAIGVALTKTIESDWLRYAVVLEVLLVEDAIALLEDDPMLDVPDSLLVRRMLELVIDEDFQGAAEIVERMRSPYTQVRSLTHIATSAVAE